MRAQDLRGFGPVGTNGPAEPFDAVLAEIMRSVPVVGRADLDRLAAAHAAEAKDAARYRWLRDRAQNAGRDPFIAQRSSYGLTQWSGDKADAAIDSAIAAQQKEAANA